MINFALMDKFNEMQTLKRRFFAMRNGVIADTMRKGGSPFKIIFGLVLPQIEEIASETGYDFELAKRLWANRSTRESMLIAPMLTDPDQFSECDVMEWTADVPSTEIADNLVHKLLRKIPDSYLLALKLARSEDSKQRYCAMRLLWHHITAHSGEVKAIAEAELLRDVTLTRQPARQIIDEIDFLESES